MRTADYLDELARRPADAPRSAPRTGLLALLQHAGNPQQRVRCIHIAGSKGKGTTALMLEAMLRAGGRRIGVFCSPHLQRWNERIRINGQPVADAALARVLEELHPHVASLHASDCNGPVFFEVLLVAALRLFEDAALDAAIIEAGIGARHDATRVVQPVVTALTTVEREHTALLGDSLTAIAADKAAVARPGMPLVLGPLPPAAQRVVTAHAAATGAPLEHTSARLVSGRRAIIDATLGVVLPAPSRAQADCAAVACGCLRAFDPCADVAMLTRAGLASLQLPGRQEVLYQRPLMIVDGAHTQASFAALTELLRTMLAPSAPLHLVLSCSGSRDLPALAAPLLARADRIVLTRADAERSVAPEQLAATLHGAAVTASIQVIEAPAAAVAAARHGLTAHGALCATGSVYMAGVARRCLLSGQSGTDSVAGCQRR